jgi:methionyl-tRNA formyltransferase
MSRYIVAAIRPWNHAAYARHAPGWPGDWSLVDSPDALTAALETAPAPRYVFFPHWSWKVPAEVVECHECVCFHMTDLPYGRGGSPLQNLIARGHRDTVLTALRMTDEMDAGPVYARRKLSLAGRAQDIYERTAEIAFALIGEIVRTEPAPAPQTGTPTVFARRTPEQSRLPESGDIAALYDHIRMLDADTYPHAFLDHGPYRIEFREAALDGGALSASVTVKVRN